MTFYTPIKVYEFDLDLRKRMTMTHYDEKGLGWLIRYVPNEQQWYRMNSDQLTPCNAEEIVTDANSLLSNLWQGDGLHYRYTTINGKRFA